MRRDGRVLPPPKTEAHPRQTQDYVLTLAKAGYLIVKERTHPKPTLYQFLPSKNSGPLPPQLQRVGTVYAPNLRQVVWADAPVKTPRGVLTGASLERDESAIVRPPSRKCYRGGIRAI